MSQRTALLPRFYEETPCPDCGQPWVLRGTGTKYHMYRGERCFGPGPSRTEVVIDYEAAVDEWTRFEGDDPQYWSSGQRERLLEAVQIIVDAALSSTNRNSD